MEACLPTPPHIMVTQEQQPLTQKGGLRTMPFIIGVKIYSYNGSVCFVCYFYISFVDHLANEAFERVASYGLLPNMILYLMRSYHMDVVTGTSVLSLWGAATNFLPLVGAFISDSYFGRFQTIALGSVASFMVRNTDLCTVFGFIFAGVDVTSFAFRG